MRKPTTSLLPFFVALTLAAPLAACEPKEDPYALPEKKSRKLSDYEAETTPEELAKAREMAGHDTKDKIEEDNAKMFEKGAREYIKTRMAAYRDFMTELTGLVDLIEKKAPKWRDDDAFAKFNEGYRESSKELTKAYDTLTKKGTEGGFTQAELGSAFRTWEDLNNSLAAGVHEQQGYPETLKEIRDRVDKVNTALDDIEKDESLEINPLYKAPKKKKKKK